MVDIKNPNIIYHNKLTFFVSTDIGNIFSQNSTVTITAKNVILDIRQRIFL